MTSVRMEWTMAEFYANDGVSRLVDRIASVLGVDASLVKVVSVYEGSLNVDFMTEILETEADPFAKASAMQATLQAAVAADPAVLGAPVL